MGGHAAAKVLKTESCGFHLGLLLRQALATKSFALLVELGLELHHFSIESNFAWMSRVASSREQDRNHVIGEILWVLSGMEERLSRLLDHRTVRADVLARKLLRRQLLDSFLYTLKMSERVLLHKINKSEPVDRKVPIVLCLRHQALQLSEKVLGE
jgi:hypothetical protein